MRRSKSANLTTFSALTPGRNCLMCWIRACSSCALKAGSPESSTRLSAKNALRITLRQLPDDLAKIAHSWGVMFGLTFLFLSALMFANARAVMEPRADYAPIHFSLYPSTQVPA